MRDATLKHWPESTRSKKKIILPLVVIFLAFGVAATLYAYALNGKDTAVLGTTVVKSSNFPLFHPQKLPAMATYRPQETVVNDTIVYTTFKNETNQIILSQQPAPPQEIKFVDSEETYTSAFGKVYILKSEPGKVKAMITAPKTLLLINADDAFSLDEVKEIISSLKLQSS